jgi:uracil-DNA glycosylase
MQVIGNQWDDILSAEYSKPYFTALMEKVDSEYASRTVFPPKDKIFEALRRVDYPDVKVVILGQDPYHEKGQANGMAFAVNEGVPLPPSLVNIFKELSDDLGINPKGSTLAGWADQGVLLLNTTLTVREGQAQSHSQLGWVEFTDAIIAALARREKPLAFILWGANAGNKASLVPPRHFVIKSAHPSPLSAYRGFFGSRPFSKVNGFLVSSGLTPINWAQVDEDKIGDCAKYYFASGKITRV